MQQMHVWHFGVIQRYYQFSGWSSGTQPPKKKSANALATADLTDVESDLLSKMADAFSNKMRFEELYESWKNTYVHLPLLKKHKGEWMIM